MINKINNCIFGYCNLLQMFLLVYTNAIFWNYSLTRTRAIYLYVKLNKPNIYLPQT